MKHFFSPILVMLAAIIPVAASADRHSNVQSALADYFSAVVKDSAVAHPALPRKNLNVKDIAQWRHTVWQAWRDANATSDEQPLSALRPLRDSVPAAWLVPQELEPNARINYFWGYKGEKPNEGWPLFLYLHGSGPRDLEWQYGRLWALRFQDAPSAYFIPQIPQEGAWYRWWQKSKQWAWERWLRLALAGGDINPYKIYFFGISEGGYGSQRLASFYADYLAGAGPMAGGEPLKNAPAENCANIAFSFLTGEKDMGFYRNTLTRYTMSAFDSLQSHYSPAINDSASAFSNSASAPNSDTLFRHRIMLIPNRGHQIDYTLTTPWLRQYSRQPWPKTVLWEDYPMDGRHRAGFYNIRVEQMPRAQGDTLAPADRRIRYDMTITGNTVCLTVRQVYYTTLEKDPMWGIELRFARTYRPATEGSVRLFLDEHLVDMRRPVTVIANGREVFRGKLQSCVQDLALSCATFFDPLRLFPASVLINLAQ